MTSESPANDGNASLDRLHTALGFKPLGQAWAKVEIVLGLLAAGIGIALIASNTSRCESESPLVMTGVGILLFMLGGYLAMAGHRSHLYQSNNKLVSYLANLIEQQHRGQ